MIMKRTDLIKILERNGNAHDIYTNGSEVETTPRHREINENLAKAIMKRRNLK